MVHMLFGRPLANSAHRSRRLLFTCSSRLQPWRPSLDDVQRLSEGRAAKTRGAGSRQVPHRLNAEEVKLFKLAKEKGFLTVKGSGYRRERKGSPLANIYRQWCDAVAAPCVLLEQDPAADAGPPSGSSSGGSGGDIVIVDLSPLRNRQRAAQVEAECQAVAAEFSCPTLDPGSLRSPFTILVPQAAFEAVEQPTAAALLQAAAAQPSAGAGAGAGAAIATTLAGPAAAGGAPTAAQDAAGEGDEVAALALSQAAAAADAQRSGGSLSEVQYAGHAQPGQQAEQQNGSDAAVAPEEDSLALTVPIWRQPPRMVAFQADRGVAKSLAKALSSAMARQGRKRT